jgi:epoxide hydrolase-like predicted phosphatase
VIRGIIFDCFGVLVHGSLGYLRDITPPELRKKLNDLSHSSDYGYLSSDEYLTRVGALLGRPADEIDAITSARRVRNERMIRLARSLHPEYKVALLSNVGRGVISETFTSNELRELFDAVVLSSEVGIVKPHADIYELVATRLGLSCEECIMIDDIPVNIEGAKAVGMQGIVCTDTEQLERDLKTLLEKNHARIA